MTHITNRRDVGNERGSSLVWDEGRKAVGYNGAKSSDRGCPLPWGFLQRSFSEIFQCQRRSKLAQNSRASLDAVLVRTGSEYTQKD